MVGPLTVENDLENMPPISAESIRNRFLSYLNEQGVALSSPIRETILIQNGYYCGRRFQAEGYTLVWFVEEDELKLYSPDGSIRWTSSPSHYVGSPTPMRRAA